MNTRMIQQMNKTSTLKPADSSIAKHSLQTAPESHYSINNHLFLQFFSLFPKGYEEGRSIIVENRCERVFRSRPGMVGEPFPGEELHLSLKFLAEFCLKRGMFYKEERLKALQEPADALQGDGGKE